MGRFASVDWSLLAAEQVPFLFVTLTTPPEYWGNARHCYRSLRRFNDWLRVQSGFRFAFIKRELGNRNGMMHYHLIIAGVEMRHYMELRKVWQRCLRAEVLPVVFVQEAQSAERVARYLSKYVSKAGYDGSEVTEVARQAADRERQSARSAACAVAAESSFLPNAHNVEADASKAENTGDSYTGGRWWYVIGDVPWADVDVLDGPDARQLAARVRRIFRRWRVQVAARALERDLGSAIAASPVGKAAIKTYPRDKLRWLEGSGGFSLFGSPDLLGQVLVAAVLAEQALGRHRQA